MQRETSPCKRFQMDKENALISIFAAFNLDNSKFFVFYVYEAYSRNSSFLG
jgi:hypothetical protein